MTTPLPQMRLLLNTLVCSLLAVTMLAACSGQEAEPPKAKKSDSAPVVPDLEAVWSSDTVDPAAVREVVRVEDLVILEERGLTALDAATGALAWHLDGADMCTSSERAVDGLFVIGYRPKGRRGADQCPVLAAVDVATGTIAWQRRIGGIRGDERGGPGLAVGERVISVKSELCGPMRRYDLRTGKVLAPIRQVQNDDYACDDWAINDHLVAQLETPDFGYRNFLSLHDTDTGKRIFRRRFPDGSLQAIVSTDPLVLDVTEKGHRLMWTVDPADGRLITPISPQFSALGEGMQPVGIEDGVVVVAGQSTRNVASSLSGLDLSGGPVRWSGFPSSGSLAGLDQGLIALSALTTSAGPRSVVTRHRFSDVADPEVLGAVTSLVARGVAGDLLILDGPAAGGGARKGVTARRLPPPGEGPDVGDIDLTWDEPAGGVAVDEDGWQKGEVRPEDVETCPVTEATLATLGFHRLDLPRPVGCDWSERREPRGVNRHLDARTWVATPLPPEYVQSGDSPKATDRAHAEMQRILEQTMVPGARGGLDAIGKRVVDLPGVGDEAHVVYGAGLGGRYGNVSILVRVANVVVHVVMEVITDPYEVVGATLPDHLEAGAWSAVEELFAGAGLSVERPTPAAPAIDEPTLRPQPALCRALAPSVAGLVPGVRGTDLRRADDEERRMAGCSWDTSADPSGNHDGVQVGIYATPSSVLTGTSGTKLARQAFRYTANTHDFADHERPVPGLGDQARVVSWDVTWLQGRIGQAKKWTAAQAYARSGNVTVVAVVQYRGLSTAALEERAIALVRETLATQKP